MIRKNYELSLENYVVSNYLNILFFWVFCCLDNLFIIVFCLLILREMLYFLDVEMLIL